MVDACEEGEEEELTVKAKREKLNSGNYFSSFVDHCNIDRVAHELMAVANEALALAQDSICHGEGRGLPENGVYSVEEHTIIAKISLENLDHITKVVKSLLPSSLFKNSNKLLTRTLNSQVCPKADQQGHRIPQGKLSRLAYDSETDAGRPIYKLCLIT